MPSSAKKNGGGENSRGGANSEDITVAACYPCECQAGGGCCDIAYDSSVSLVTGYGEGFVHCVVGVSGESDHTLCWS